MADDQTKLIISIETVLRNLDRTLAGLSKVEAQLKRISSIKPNTSATALDKAVLSSQRLAIQSQELANRQAKAQLTADRLALSQLKLEQSFNRAAIQAVRQAKATQLNADAHVKSFKAIEAHRKSLEAQADAHVKAFKAIEANRKALAVQADAHVKAFRAIEASRSKEARNAAEVARINAQTARQAETQAQIRERAARTLSAVEVREARRGAIEVVKGLEASRLATEAFAKRLEGLGNSLRSIGQGLTSVGFTLSAALTAPLVALGVSATQASITLDSLKRGLTAITGSASEAETQLKRLTDIAKLPGIGFQEAIQGSIRLQAVGFSAKDAEKALIEFSNAIALTGGGREELARVTVQLGQLAAKGKVLSQDLRPIIEAAPAVGRALLQAFGTVNADDIAALSGSSKQFFETLVAELENLPRAASGARNAFDNFRDSVFRASTALGDALLPILTKLADIALPVIEAIAAGFRALPFPIQAVIVVFGGLLAILGPALIVIGQLTVGVGRLSVGLAQLKVQAGEAATSMEALALASTQVRTGAVGAAAGLARFLGPVAAIASLIALAAIAFSELGESEAEAVKISNEQIANQESEIKNLKEQVRFLDSLEDGVARTADEQDRLLQIYESLNTQAKIRVTGITDEEKRLAELRLQLQRLLQIREQERIQQTANLVASLAGTTAEIGANRKSRDSIAERVKANTALIESIQQAGKVTVEHSRQLETLGLSGAATASQAIFDLGKANENLIRRQDELIQASEQLNGTAKEQGEAISVLTKQTGLSARELLVAAKSMGVFKGDIEATLPAIERYITKTDQATDSTRRFNQQLSENERKLNEAGERADAAAKRRQTIIQSAAAVARETSLSFESALKSLRESVQAVPELRQAIERESVLSGKSLEETIRNALENAFKGRDKDKSGTALRNAQERLQQQLTDVTEAELAKRLAGEKASNEELLRANELSFARQLRSYREYLETRALFTEAAVDEEITRQREIATVARQEAARLTKESQRRDIPETERVNRQTQANQELEKALKAEAKLADLESQRDDIANQLQVDLAQLAKQQEADTRQLGIEYQELQGRIEDALRAETVERFRERLTDLARDQEAINKRLAGSAGKLTGEERQRLQLLGQRNQAEIDAIELRKQQLDALATLKTAEAFVSRKKQEQADLEEQLKVDVEFRGKTEQQAVRERLTGEDALKQRLLISRDIVQDTINRLRLLGQEVPKELGDFVNQINLQVQSLGRLPFSEQFRLAGLEFDKANDERLRRIEDVNRAVSRRVISEQQGVLQIRNINREYTAELERQLDLLEQIAEESNNPDLLRQVHQLQDAVKDANTELEDFATELRSVSIDALQSGLEDFFANIGDRTKTAKEKLLDLLNSVAGSINAFIAKRLSEKLIESIFGSGDKAAADGIIVSLKRVFGFGDKGAVGGIGQAATGAAAGTTLTAAAATAGTALVTGGATASASLVTAGVAFSSAVIAAGAAFAAAVTASSTASAVGGLGGLGSASAFAATGLFPAVPGGVVRVVEGGFPEAVLTTDPKHALQQVDILRQFLAYTRGLGGRIQGLETGGFVTPRQAEASLLSSIQRVPLSNSGLSQLAVAGGDNRPRNFRAIFVDDMREAANWWNSPEGDEVFVEKLVRHRSTIRRFK